MSKRLVMVTGGAGFIGSNVVAELAGSALFDIAVCDRLGPAADGKWRNLAKSPLADFIAPEQLFDWLSANKADLAAVVHMGAISATTEPDADLILQTNFALSRDLWRWCARMGTTLIYASSAATYGAGEQGFDDDDDPASLAALRPLNAYGWSKAFFDRWARAEADLGSAPPSWAGLKFFNVYGPNEAHKGGMRSVVHQLWLKASLGGEVTLFRSHNPAYGDGGQMRDFVYVLDCARVIAWMLDQKSLCGVYNLGTGEARSFLDLANATFAAAGQSPHVSFIDTPLEIRDKYQYFTQARMSRLRAVGYAAPFYGLEDGIRDYVQKFLARSDPYR
jgi:ADP-L-glycero-D-manno-heptose 6-epimerase